MIILCDGCGKTFDNEFSCICPNCGEAYVDYEDPEDDCISEDENKLYEDEASDYSFEDNLLSDADILLEQDFH